MDNRDLIKSNKLILRRETQKAKEVYSKWKDACWHSGCPLNPSMDTADGQTCGWHFQSAFPAAITCAIKNNFKYLAMYSKMVKWNEEDWRRQTGYLETKAPFRLEKSTTPAKPNQLRSVYLTNFFKWIDSKIKEEASEQIS